MEEIVNAINRASYLQRCVNSPLPRVREMFEEAFDNEISSLVLNDLMLNNKGCVDKWFAGLNTVDQEVFLSSPVFEPY